MCGCYRSLLNKEQEEGQGAMRRVIGGQGRDRWLESDRRSIAQMERGTGIEPA